MNTFDPRSTSRGAAPPAFVAANDDHAAANARPLRTLESKLGSVGWDPFEIWRTRVRDARRDAALPRAG
jgi:hypothetical protein